MHHEIFPLIEELRPLVIKDNSREGGPTANMQLELNFFQLIDGWFCSIGEACETEEEAEAIFTAIEAMDAYYNKGDSTLMEEYGEEVVLLLKKVRELIDSED
jgi:hypothetical protein